MKKYIKPELEEMLPLTEKIMDDLTVLSEEASGDLDDLTVKGVIQIKFN